MSFSFSIDGITPKKHRYLKWSDTQASRGTADKISTHLLNKLCNGTFTAKQLRQNRFVKLTIQEKEGHPPRIIEFNFETFSADLRRIRTIPEKKYNLPKIGSHLFDSPLHISRTFHFLSSEHDGPINMVLKTPYGEAFPLLPSLDREGVAFASFQPELLKNIKHLASTLVENSHAMTEIDTSWMTPLRMLTNDLVSTIEITLHQLYFAAQYGYNPKWKYDPEKLGHRHGRRLSDKLKWVGMICGAPLDNITAEAPALKTIRELRNHLSHFDPPCVCITIEDVANWLNLIPAIATIVWKIRERLGEQINSHLVELLLLPKVEFQPRNSYPRLSLPPHGGYSSSCW